MNDISDVFWQLETATYDINEDIDIATDTDLTFAEVVYEISSVCGCTRSDYEKHGGEIRLSLGELRDDGVTCAVGGELWESSILLSCFMMFHYEKWYTKHVMELGSGVGIPGLLVSTLRGIDMALNGDERASTPRADVFMTDYDREVLDNLSHTCRKQFSREYQITEVHDKEKGDSCGGNSFVSQQSTTGFGLHICQLDWMLWKDGAPHDYLLTTAGSCIGEACGRAISPPTSPSPSMYCEIIMGSELVYTPPLSCVADVIVGHILQGAAKEAVIIQMHSRTGYASLLHRLEALCTASDVKDAVCAYRVDTLPAGLYECAEMVRRCTDTSRGPVLPGDHPPGDMDWGRGGKDECIVFPPALSLLSNFHTALNRHSGTLALHDKGIGESMDLVNGRAVLTSPADAFRIIRVWRTGHRPMGLDVFEGLSVRKMRRNGETTGREGSPMSGRVDKVQSPESESSCAADVIGLKSGASTPSFGQRESLRAINTPFQLRIGTFNIHNAHRNVAAYVDLFLEHRLNVIVLQECSLQAYEEMEKALKPLGFCGVYSPAAYAGNCLLTSLHLLRSCGVSSYSASSGAEMRSAVVGVVHVPLSTAACAAPQQCEGCVEVCVLGVHLSHVHERDRFRQMKEFLAQVETPCIVVGDLNALFEPDYCDQTWSAIGDLRARNRWPTPQSSIMEYLLNTLKYRDCWRESKKTWQLQEDGSSCYSCDYGLLRPGRRKGLEPDPTCRFDTRIDWILLPPLEQCKGLSTTDGALWSTITMEPLCAMPRSILPGFSHNDSIHN